MGSVLTSSSEPRPCTVQLPPCWFSIVMTHWIDWPIACRPVCRVISAFTRRVDWRPKFKVTASTAFPAGGLPAGATTTQDSTTDTTLLATDSQRSVLQVLENTQPRAMAYLPYGHRAAQSGLSSLLGFNGERADPVTGHYLLGNGYRVYNPVLMRFNSPDSWSPFGRGGLNAYAYCDGDSVNKVDPMGMPVFSERSEVS